MESTIKSFSESTAELTELNNEQGKVEIHFKFDHSNHFIFEKQCRKRSEPT